jgi:hypothetical protein
MNEIGDEQATGSSTSVRESLRAFTFSRRRRAGPAELRALPYPTSTA